jgi:aminoglycoside phosphotransferase family enzyme
MLTRYDFAMSYSQEPLLTLFKSGAYVPEEGDPQIIETVISNVFLTKERGYKIYKNDNAFFNEHFRDLSSGDARHAFTKADFAWNHTLSPEIYTACVGVRVTGGTIERSDDEPEELVIEMKRVRNESFLFQKLIGNELTPAIAHDLGKQLAHELSKVQKPATDENFYDLFGKRVDDVAKWIASVPDNIAESEWQQYINFLESYRRSHKDVFDTELTSEVMTDGDFHSHNAVIVDEKLRFMDTFPPKDEWGIGIRMMPVYRLGTDMWAMSADMEVFEQFITGYVSHARPINRAHEPVFIVYASCIAVSYLYMLQRTDSAMRPHAERYHVFLKNYYASHCV